jgi:hypothetical protein
VEGVRDTSALFNRILSVRIFWSRDNFLAAWKQVQFIVQDQEEKNLRDLAPILIVSPPTEAADTEVYITVVMLWTGIDSGDMDLNGWTKRYWKPFLKLDHLPFPTTMNIMTPLSAATRMLANLWTNHHDKYAVQAFHSDYWWDNEFIEKIADELVERNKLIPDMYPSFQFLPLGQQTQWARNDGINALTWRDARAYVDDWMFVKNESRYDEAVTRMVNFREKNRRFWQYKDGSDRSTWMSPSTTYPNATDLRNATIAKQYFHNTTQFQNLQRLKAELDPADVFANKGTIPLLENMYAEVLV